jgi:HSP20 family molecular chaperone IbpA
MKTHFDKALDEIFDMKFGFDSGINQTNIIRYTEVEQVKNEDGSYTLYINALGHTLNDLDINVTPKTIKIKSDKKCELCKLIRPIDLTYKLGVGIDYDAIDAEFSNGLLIIQIPIRGDTDEKNTRKIKIKN